MTASRRSSSTSMAWRAALAAAWILATLAGPIAPSAADSISSATPGADTAVVAEAPPSDEEFPVVLGAYSTTLAGSVLARTDNVRLAARAIDGQVLEPGEVLSFNRVVGPRTTERGYQWAPVILHEARGLQVGGGVCQVSSTLFVAALLSGLGTVERHRHSSPVDYIALGEDATISWGAKDLRVRNDLSQRVRLRIEIVGATLTARFEGEEPLAESFELETEEREIPGDPASGVEPGREIEVYRKSQGRSDRELLHRDRFPPYRVGQIREAR